MEANPETTADRDGNAPPPRIDDLPIRRKLLPLFLTFVPTLMGHYLAWGVLDLLDPEFEHAFITLTLPFVYLSAFFFMSAARPWRKLHWAILGGATVVSVFLGTLGHYLSIRLLAPMTRLTMFGELPAFLTALTGMVAAVGLATGVWLLFRRLTRDEGLWLEL